MKKRWMMPLLILITVVVLVFAILPYWFGLRTEKTMRSHQHLLEQNSVVEVVKYDYQRGWFDSTETTVLRFRPNLVQKLGGNVPDNLKAIINEPFTITNHIKHGPFAGGITPVKAMSTSEVVFSPRAKQSLERFFRSQVPLTVKNRLNLMGGGVMNLQVPAFQYEELSGIAIDWKGLDVELDYSDNYDSYQVKSHSGGINVKLADKGQLALENLDYTADSSQNPSGLNVGSNEFKVAKAMMAWSEGVDYNIKLNSIVNMMSDLQIGAFINPTGTVAPNNIAVNNFSLKRTTDEKDGFANAEAVIHFDQLHYGKDVYGPLNVKASAEHLHADALVKLNDGFFKLSNTKLDEAQYRDALITLAKTEGLPIFTNNPVFKISQFDLKMPDSQLKFTAEFGFKGLQAADMETFNSLMAKTEAKVHVNAPQVLLENLAVAQADSIFSVDPDVENPPSMEEVRDTARMLVRSTINNMASVGYLTQKDGLIDSEMVVKNNELLLNGKRFETTPQQDIDDLMEEDATASGVQAASVPVAASAAK